MRKLPERRAYIQPKVGALVAVCKDWPTAKTIPRGMEMAKKFGLEFLPTTGA